jgi:hypothetical protein
MHCQTSVAKDERCPTKLDSAEQSHLCIEKAIFQLMSQRLTAPQSNMVPEQQVRAV